MFVFVVCVDFGLEDFDFKGWWIEVDFFIGDCLFIVVSVYVYFGEVDIFKQDEKWKFFDVFEVWLVSLNIEGVFVFVIGDFNVGYCEFDIKNWWGNCMKVGFFLCECVYFDCFFGEVGVMVIGVDGLVGFGLGWVDVGCCFYGEVDGLYMWWFMCGKVFDNDFGWCIDYYFVMFVFVECVEMYYVVCVVVYDQWWSDYVLVVVDYCY